MTKSREYIRNHYVPKTYLKRFTDPSKWIMKKNFIDTLYINEQIIRNVDIETQCQIKNLYKLPESFSMEDKKVIEKAFMGYADGVFSKAMVNSYDQGLEPKIADLNGILWFVIYQSFRTPKFKIHHISKAKELSLKMGKYDSDLEEYSYWLGYLLVKSALEIYKFCLTEILISKSPNWFITSDNPASFWLKTWNSAKFLGTILGHHEDTNLKLVCPINPQVTFVLHLNYLKKTNIDNTAQRIQYFTRTIEREEVAEINNLIYNSSEKQVFSIDRSILTNLQKH
jgi:hypothetical protein